MREISSELISDPLRSIKRRQLYPNILFPRGHLIWLHYVPYCTVVSGLPDAVALFL